MTDRIINLIEALFKALCGREPEWQIERGIVPEITILSNEILSALIYLWKLLMKSRIFNFLKKLSLSVSSELKRAVFSQQASLPK